MARRLAVIGGDAGGMAAATQARRLDSSLEIVAFERTEWTSYSACGIPYLVGGEVAELEQLVARSPQEHRDKSLIDMRVRHEVMGIDLDAGRLEVRDHGHGRTIQVPFDLLLLGMGARPIRPDLPGIDLAMVQGVQTLADAARLLHRAETSECDNVVVVGGGYIGLELAEAFVARKARVTVVESRDHVMATLDPDMAIPIEDAMRRAGIDVRLGTKVTGFEEGAVETSNGSVPADLVVLGIGVEPNSELAEDAGIELGTRRSIRVDRRQHTSAPDVWAAGDCAQSVHLVSGQPVYVALGTVATRQARVAGINIGGGYATMPGVLGTAVTRICDTEIGRTGLNEREASEAAFEYVAATIDSTTTASYFADPPQITLKLLAEQRSGRVLGAQVVGGRGAAKRIDVLATAITAGMNVQQLVDLDLGYAPPVSPLWDPVATAARVALSKL
ncbi:MAG TPA: FAD-dependent oxidoreductase [Acidimicrobiales bacterium]|jgi:NADPH-dependent 2,4-dienoyl-CoA reductase/sulfur reductase-like enzyme